MFPSKISHVRPLSKHEFLIVVESPKLAFTPATTERESMARMFSKMDLRATCVLQLPQER